MDKLILGSEGPSEREPVFLQKHDSDKRKRKCICSKGTKPKSNMSDHSDGTPKTNTEIFITRVVGQI